MAQVSRSHNKHGASVALICHKASLLYKTGRDNKEDKRVVKQQRKPKEIEKNVSFVP